MIKQVLRMMGTCALGTVLTVSAQQKAMAQTNGKNVDAVYKQYFEVDTSAAGGLFIRCDQKGDGSVSVYDVIYSFPKAEIFFVGGKKRDYMEKIALSSEWNDVFMCTRWDGNTDLKQVSMKDEKIKTNVALIMQDAQHVCGCAAQQRKSKEDGVFAVKVAFSDIGDAMETGGAQAFFELGRTINPPKSNRL